MEFVLAFAFVFMAISTVIVVFRDSRSFKKAQERRDKEFQEEMERLRVRYNVPEKPSGKVIDFRRKK